MIVTHLKHVVRHFWYNLNFNFRQKINWKLWQPKNSSTFDHGLLFSHKGHKVGTWLYGKNLNVLYSLFYFTVRVPSGTQSIGSKYQLNRWNYVFVSDIQCLQLILFEQKKKMLCSATGRKLVEKKNKSQNVISIFQIK